MLIKIPLHTGAYSSGLEGVETLESVDDKIQLIGNPLDTNTKLLFHADGADGSITFTDISDSAHTLAPVAEAQVDTAQKKFGTGSLFLDGENDEVEATGTLSDFQFGSGKWTMEGRFYLNEVMGSNNLLFTLGGGVNSWADADGFEYLLYTNTDSKLRFDYRVGTSIVTIITSNVIDVTSSFHHVALVNNDITDAFLMFIDGAIVYAAGAITITAIGSPLNFSIGGSAWAGHSGAHWDGWIDEPYVLKGTAKYSDTFTPEISAYNNYLITSPATTGTWTALPRGTLDMSTSRLLIFKDGIVQAATSTDVKIRYYYNNGAASAWLTLAALRLETDIDVTNTINSIKVETQYISDKTYRSGSRAFLVMDYTHSTGGGANQIIGSPIIQGVN